MNLIVTNKFVIEKMVNFSVIFLPSVISFNYIHSVLFTLMNRSILKIFLNI